MFQLSISPPTPPSVPSASFGSIAELVSDKSLPKENKRFDNPTITKTPSLQGPNPLDIKEEYLNAPQEVEENPVFEVPDVFDGLFDEEEVAISGPTRIEEAIPSDSLAVILNLITDTSHIEDIAPLPFATPRPRSQQVCCLLLIRCILLIW